jgi:hydroxymethylpyrimidine pyrophosphatase-like HAD family hydrolase
MDISRRHPRVTFLLHSRDAIHMLWPHTYGIEASLRYDHDTVPFDPAAPAPPYSKVMCLSLEPEDLKAVYRDAEGLSVERAYSMPSILEFTPAGMNKGEGLARLITALGLDGAQVLAAGDGGNDLALFEQVSLSFAPATSQPAVQARADRVIDVEREGLLAPMLRAAGIRVD